MRQDTRSMELVAQLYLVRNVLFVSDYTKINVSDHPGLVHLTIKLFRVKVKTSCHIDVNQGREITWKDKENIGVAGLKICSKWYSRNGRLCLRLERNVWCIIFSSCALRPTRNRVLSLGLNRGGSGNHQQKQTFVHTKPSAESSSEIGSARGVILGLRIYADLDSSETLTNEVVVIASYIYIYIYLQLQWKSLPLFALVLLLSRFLYFRVVNICISSLLRFLLLLRLFRDPGHPLCVSPKRKT